MLRRTLTPLMRNMLLRILLILLVNLKGQIGASGLFMNLEKIPYA